ncbi:hypothetical protein E1B28_009267 [Marasmius oreades]|uniref:F-box domain-containing protein n=1 Tax=Marasmius oreades TaxID=181124 RepID=A0A9P7S047_9AGAR|nr:uncharacterized protein E1B28_009267 [Marasmius oreades]KAG7092966.1 hypothetical protein E1B28_009267 [Marasmius oreades]
MRSRSQTFGRFSAVTSRRCVIFPRLRSGHPLASDDACYPRKRFVVFGVELVRRLVATMRTSCLPLELLFHIFECLPRPHQTPDIWRCAQVCRRWRTTLCKVMPWLWSTIELDADALQNINVLCHYLKRSHGRPLSITLKRCIRLAFNCEEGSDSDTASSKLEDYLEVLIPHCARWQDFSCQGLLAHELEQFAPVKGRLPLLRHLHLYIHDDFLHDYPTDIDSFSIAPNLRSVRVLGTHLPRPPLVLPWTQLDFYQANQSHRHLVDVLHKAPEMGTCMISSRPSVHVPYAGPSVYHENLHTLSVHGTHVLSHLSLPSLRNLTLTLNNPLELVALTSFLKGNTKFPLRELKLTGRFCATNLSFSDLLKDLFTTTSASSLTTLDFGLLIPQACNILYSLLTLTTEDEHTCILPELECLTIHPSLLKYHCETMLLAMMSSRVGARRPRPAPKIKLGERESRNRHRARLHHRP